MHYVVEKYYLDQETITLDQLLRTSSTALAPYCHYYFARIIVPLKGYRDTIRQGELPTSEADKQRLILELLDWIQAHSDIKSLFELILDPEPIDARKHPHVELFAHYDDTSMWYLNLDDAQFQVLQKGLVAAELPSDAFYPEQNATITQIEGQSIFAKIGRLLHFQKYYSPKEWQAKLEKDKLTPPKL